MSTTINLYLSVIGFILLVCKISIVHATEISPIFGLGQENFGFSISEYAPNSNPTGRSKIDFEPNMAGVSRLGLNLYGFSIGYSFRGSAEGLDPAKGKTEFFDLQLGYHNKKWGIDSFYQTYKGFHTTNTNQIQLFPELKFLHYGLMGRYALNDSEFSVGALLDQSEEIKNSAGKWYLLGGVRHHEMESPTSLMQSENAGLNSELEKLRLLTTTSLNTGIGAGYYWVSSFKFFMGGVLDLLGTYGLYSFKNDAQQKEKSSYGTLSSNFRLGLGYAGQTFKSGVSLTTDTTTLKAPGNALIKPSAQRALIYIRITY